MVKHRKWSIGGRSSSEGTPKMYGELASWWHVLSSPEDYADEAAFIRRVLVDACETTPKTMLELGSGGGNNASHLKRDFELTLVDCSPGMLAVSRELNPQCGHVEGDMRTVRLGRLFDAVLIHDAIIYMTTVEDLRAAMETAWVHLRPGCAALLVPDDVRENFKPYTKHGGHDVGSRSLRYLEWVQDAEKGASTYITDFAYLLCEGNGSVRVVHDRHVCGVFSRHVWLRLLGEIGFESTVVPDQYGRDVFLARKLRDCAA